MVTYRIVCTTFEYMLEHRHIVEVGVSTDPGKATERWYVLVSASSRNIALMSKFMAANSFAKSSKTSGWDGGLSR